jgi:glycosyltransferase involved in cell wall biosynthesis
MRFGILPNLPRRAAPCRTDVGSVPPISAMDVATEPTSLPELRIFLKRPFEGNSMNSTKLLPDVTVVTLTRERPRLLRRAIASVAAQRCDAVVRHQVIIDDCTDTLQMLELATDLPPGVSWTAVRRRIEDEPKILRISRLRNLGVRLARSEWIAFLDDDNEWTVEHLATLLECASRDNVRAAHSYMQMLWPDGSPYLDSRKPWCHDEASGRAKYREWIERGIFESGSNIARDRMDPLGHPNPARTVDIGEWLLKRELLLAIPFAEEYTDLERKEFLGEDDKLMAGLLEADERISCSGMATLRYYLGGFSNGFAQTLSVDEGARLDAP